MKTNKLWAFLLGLLAASPSFSLINITSYDTLGINSHDHKKPIRIIEVEFCDQEQINGSNISDCVNQIKEESICTYQRSIEFYNVNNLSHCELILKVIREIGMNSCLYNVHSSNENEAFLKYIETGVRAYSLEKKRQESLKLLN